MDYIDDISTLHFTSTTTTTTTITTTTTTKKQSKVLSTVDQVQTKQKQQKSQQSNNQQNQQYRHQDKTPDDQIQTNQWTELESILVKFQQDSTSMEYTFPSTLSSYERRLVHEISEKLGLEHESKGEGISRHVVVKKVPSRTEDLKATEVQFSGEGEDEKVEPTDESNNISNELQQPIQSPQQKSSRKKKPKKKQPGDKGPINPKKLQEDCESDDMLLEAAIAQYGNSECS